MLRTERTKVALIHVCGMSPMKRGALGLRQVISCHSFHSLGR
jgi:hypothetical protein